MARQDLEALFLANLPVAEKILSVLGRRNALSREVAEDFGSWAKECLIEDDYAIIGKFRGESTFPTYLNVVLSTLYKEYRVKEWGRWRPSAEAKRGGQLAMSLETLMCRDGLSLRQAGEMLRTSGETMLNDGELAKIASKFPMRSPLRPVQSGEARVEPAGPARADDLVVASEGKSEWEAAMAALERAMDALPAEDRLIVRLRFMEGMSVADIARALCLPQPALYKRLDRILSGLRVSLERAGVSREYIADLTRGPP